MPSMLPAEICIAQVSPIQAGSAEAGSLQISRFEVSSRRSACTDPHRPTCSSGRILPPGARSNRPLVRRAGLEQHRQQQQQGWHGWWVTLVMSLRCNGSRDGRRPAPWRQPASGRRRLGLSAIAVAGCSASLVPWTPCCPVCRKRLFAITPIVTKPPFGRPSCDPGCPRLGAPGQWCCRAFTRAAAVGLSGLLAPGRRLSAGPPLLDASWLGHWRCLGTTLVRCITPRQGAVAWICNPTGQLWSHCLKPCSIAMPW